MEDFLDEAHAPRSDRGSAREPRKFSARSIARGLSAAVLPRRGFVKGVSERWDPAHLGKTPTSTWTGYSGYAPVSPEASEELEFSPERVGPLSFERRRRLVADHLQSLTPLQQL